MCLHGCCIRICTKLYPKFDHCTEELHIFMADTFSGYSFL